MSSDETDRPRRPASQLASLDEARAQIDAIDSALLALLAERQAHVDKVTALKAVAGVAAAAPSRVVTVLASVRRRAAEQGVDPDIAEAMWRVMIERFIAREERVLGKEGEDR